MSLIAVVTDSHFGARKGAQYLHDHFEKFWRDVFFPTLKERGVKTILHMGDAFDSRKSIGYESLNWAKRVVFEPMKEFNTHIIVGNHDCYYKSTNRTNSPDLLLKDYDNITTYHSPTEVTLEGMDTLLLPWICDENREESLRMIKNSTSKFAAGHLELDGFEAYRGHTYRDGKLDNGVFDNFDKVFSGHFHTRSNNGKIFYTGNPYEMFWNDVNDTRGFVLLDTETLEFEYVNNPHTLFSVIYYEDTNYKLFNAKEYEGKIVKVIVRKNTDRKLFDKFLDKLMKTNILDMKIVENFNVQEGEDFQVEDIEENTLSILNRYVDEADYEDSSIQKDDIKNLISQIYREACEV